MILSGKSLAASVRNSLALAIGGFSKKPKLAVVLAGKNPASIAYVEQKRKACEEIGMGFELVELPGDADEGIILAAVRQKNADPETDGVIVQMPLPPGVDRNRIIDAIDPTKDVDGFTDRSVAKVLFGREDGFLPCTPKGILRLLESYAIPVAGKDVTVIGHGNIVGKPLSILLANLGATVTVCHSKTRDIAQHAAHADIVVVAAGKPGLLTARMVKPGAVVIDVGINRMEHGLVGDADFEAISAIADITPVPGGVGPMTVAMLLENTFEAFSKRNDAF